MTEPLVGEDPPGATPLESEDLDGLLPAAVATREDLNTVEQTNIEKGFRWLSNAGRSPDEIVSIQFSDELHRRLFGDVWRWAGEHRRRATNIGVDWHQIVECMHGLFEDVKVWLEHDTYLPIEQAVRLHWRLVQIHPYRNGNGRHTRIMANAYLASIGGDRLPWGQGSDLAAAGNVRHRYIAALKSADRGDLEPLLNFAVS